MARNMVVRTGRMAAAAFASLEDQKEYQFNRRLVLGPSAIRTTPQTERVQMAACGLQDVCHDAVVLGSSLAEDPAVQAAVLAKIKNSPDLLDMMSVWGLDKQTIEVAEIQKQAKELQTELEWQQDLYQDMINHADSLAEERVQLKARVVSLERENDRLRTDLERVQGQQDQPQERAQEAEPEAREPEAREPEGRAGQAEARQERAAEPGGAVIVLQMALAVAAVVIALVVARRVPATVRASAILGAVFNAFGAFRKS